MADKITTAELIRQLAARERVMVLGGFAVIAHGHSRPTYDADVWLDPLLPVQEWCEAIRRCFSVYPGFQFVEIGSWRAFEWDEFPLIIERDGVIRIMGAHQPLDAFRHPNELDAGLFDEVWERARPLEDGTRLPDAIDLLVTKQLTGREKDRMDILFLEQKAETESLKTLHSADSATALALIERFLTPKVAAAACDHADPAVRQKGRQYLKELADAGDPFAVDLLRERSPA